MPTKPGMEKLHKSGVAFHSVPGKNPGKEGTADEAFQSLFSCFVCIAEQSHAKFVIFPFLVMELEFYPAREDRSRPFNRLFNCLITC